jgi:hypothetical protein
MFKVRPVSVKSFFVDWSFPWGFVLRRVVVATAALTATLGTPSMTTLFPTHVQPGATPSSSIPGTDLSFPTGPTPSASPGGPFGVEDPSQLTVAGIPPLAYQAYVDAATTLKTTDPTC